MTRASRPARGPRHGGRDRPQAGVDVIPLPAAGEVMRFSGAQLHTSDSNTSAGQYKRRLPHGTPGTAGGRWGTVADADCTGHGDS